MLFLIVLLIIGSIICFVFMVNNYCEGVRSYLKKEEYDLAITATAAPFVLVILIFILIYLFKYVLN